MVTNIVFPHLALYPADGPNWGGEHDENESDRDQREEDHLEGEWQRLALVSAVKGVKTVGVIVIVAT